MTENRFLLKGDNVDATGEPTEAGFVVRAGSIARKEISPSVVDSLMPIRTRLLSDGVLVEEDGKLRFALDHEFRSPSGASYAVLGRASNGWNDWKHADGRTLSEVKRVTRSSGDTMLSDTKRQQIIEAHRSLIEDGKIATEERLHRQYEVFRRRFGPDVLRDLDGEDLLELLHGHGNKDSLVYWLEFKNDDEFDTRRFGSIAGGSSLKFRVFRRQETGHWQAADSTNRPKDIPLAKAIDFARTHRDQLLSGVELLDNLPIGASDDDYAELQDQMAERAPDVSKLAWAHKYFCLLFPDKLDDYHSVGWQRYHIIALLQLPPKGDGRYIYAGRFAAAAREVDLPLHDFTAALNAVQGRPHRYWRIGTRGGKTSYWPMMQQLDSVAIGWPDLGDLSWVEAKQASRERLKELLKKKDGRSPQAAGRAASEIVHFIATIQEGDIVLASDGATVLGIGRVTGEYRYESEYDFPNHRSVEWLQLEEWQMPFTEGLQSVVRELKKFDENIVEIERRSQNGVPPVKPPTGGVVAKRHIRLDGIPGRIQSVLDRKSQVILYGPPGTGKTYWAERAAFDLAAIAMFGSRFDDLGDGDKLSITGDGNAPGVARLCCFHSAYGYEDFLEGYRPHSVDGGMSFDLRDGVFKQICRDAAAAPDRSFYLIVDEINRGDIPRIFGELMTILEKDKRTKQIILPVSQEVFSIPRNVFVIGTMNTADRSISLLDAALRRRFGFVEMMPDGTVLRDSVVSGIPLRAWFDALNSRVREHVGRDSRNLQIGHSYLMQGGSPVKDLASLKRAVRDDIIPLLEEYCYEDYGTLSQILGEELVDMTKQRIRHELFSGDQDPNLIQALLAPCPEISSTSEAISSEKSQLEPEEDEDEEP